MSTVNYFCALRPDRVFKDTITSGAPDYYISFEQLLQYTHFELTFVNTTLNDGTPDVFNIVLPNKETQEGIEFWNCLENKLGRKLRVDELVSLFFTNLSGNVIVNVQISGVGTINTYYNDFFRLPQYVFPNLPTTNMVQLREFSVSYTDNDKSYRGL